MHKIISEDVAYIIAKNLTWDKFSGKTVLISGAAGFLASYLVHTLMHLNKLVKLSKPVKVIALVRNEQKAKQRFIEYLSDDNFKLLIVDISEPLALPEEVHYIIHAASQASPKYYGNDPVGTLKPNILGTIELLKLAQKSPIEAFLYFSSGEVYGQNDTSSGKLDEQAYGYLDPINVRSCYAESKRMGENLCVSWHHQYNVPVKIVRPFHTYGPGMSLDDGRVFADFVADIILNRDITVNSDGSAVRAFCYLADATIGFFTVLLNGKVAQAYNVGNSDAAVSILELANILVNIYPEKDLKVIVNTANNITNSYLQSPIKLNSPDISKIKELGWAPHYGIAEGFERTINSFMN